MSRDAPASPGRLRARGAWGARRGPPSNATLPARPGLHRIGHPRDDPRRRPARRREPGAGYAELPAAARADRGGPPRDRRRLPPVRDHLGHAEPQKGDRREVPQVLPYGGRARPPRDDLLRLEPPDFTFDPDRLRRAVTPRTRAIIFNSPNNPTGKVFSRQELQIIADLCLEHDLLAITDEIYEHIVYDGLGHTPIATLPGMAERTVTISGISKSYSVTGWRVGYAVAPPELAIGIRRAHDFVTVGAPHPLQEAAVTALRFPDAYYVGLREGYQKRRDLLWRYIESAGFVAWKPNGAYYSLTDAARFMKAARVDDDYAFAMWLIKECGVATVPGSSFYAHTELGRTKIRFCFPKTDDMLTEAGERLQKLRTFA